MVCHGVDLATILNVMLLSDDLINSTLDFFRFLKCKKVLYLFIFRKIQLKIRRFIDHLSVRLFGIFLILLDIVLMIVDLSLGPKPPSTQIVYDSLAMTLSCIFMADLLLRIFSYG